MNDERWILVSLIVYFVLAVMLIVTVILKMEGL